MSHITVRNLINNLEKTLKKDKRFHQEKSFKNRLKKLSKKSSVDTYEGEFIVNPLSNLAGLNLQNELFPDYNVSQKHIVKPRLDGSDENRVGNLINKINNLKSRLSQYRSSTQANVPLGQNPFATQTNFPLGHGSLGTQANLGSQTGQSSKNGQWIVDAFKVNAFEVNELANELDDLENIMRNF